MKAGDKMLSSRWWTDRSQNTGATCLYPLAQRFIQCDPRPGPQHLHHLGFVGKCIFSGPTPELLNQNFWKWGPGICVFKPSRCLSVMPVFGNPLLWSDHWDFPWEYYFEFLFNSAAAALKTPQWPLKVWLINYPSSSTCARGVGPGARRPAS